MLDSTLKAQLNQYFTLLEAPIVFSVRVTSDENGKKMRDFLEEVAALSDKITIQEASLERTPSFAIHQSGVSPRIFFAGIPLGHEFTSFVLAMLQVSGRAPKVEEALAKRIAAIEGEYHFVTYASLTCQNCPDVVQALNIMSVLNNNITNTMVDGAMFREEVEEKEIFSVPTVYLNGEFFTSGRTSIEALTDELSEATDEIKELPVYDCLVVGGGPAAASAAIYAARKGIKTGVICDDFGGQPTQTLGIENIAGLKYVEGTQLMATMEDQLKSVGVDILKGKRATKLEKADLTEVTLENNQVVQTKTAILATGATWRKLGIPGETEFLNKGVAYCPHCDGPLFKDRDVVVIGGGNSGIEAAIDLAGICKSVTVLEFLPELKADIVLQEAVKKIENITVLTNVETKAITGSTKVDGVTYVDRVSGKEQHVAVEGVFVLVGMVPNASWLADSLDLDARGYISVDKDGRTSLPSVFACGDVTDSTYKQIVISMGTGATAALAAFDYLIRMN
jgi:alkyl hydroperoxide reductase subunit F